MEEYFAPRSTVFIKDGGGTLVIEGDLACTAFFQMTDKRETFIQNLIKLAENYPVSYKVIVGVPLEIKSTCFLLLEAQFPLCTNSF